MAQSNTGTLTWAANTESDLAGYIAIAGPESSFTWPNILISPLLTGGVTVYVFTVPAGAPDGLWYFTVRAQDTSNNHSNFANPVSKRLVRTSSKLVVKR